MKTFGILYGEQYTFEPFHRPSYFDEWYRGIMLLETRIKLANGISGQLYSDMMVSDRLKNQLHTDHLHPRQYLYGMLDSLMEICGLPDTKVYTYREARNRILAEFAPALDDSYFSSMLNVIDVAASLGALGSKELISRLVHFSFYPEHTVAGENVILTVAPYEYALAQLVTYMMKELEEE